MAIDDGVSTGGGAATGSGALITSRPLIHSDPLHTDAHNVVIFSIILAVQCSAVSM